MPTKTDSPSSAASDEARRSLRVAWIWVAVIPVAFVAAMILGEGILTVQGYDSGETSLPTRPVLVAGIPAILVMIAPTIPAIRYGLRARRRGVGHGIIPAGIAVFYLAFAVLTNMLSFLFTRL
ncbi:MAG: hypothetical protein ACXWXF_10365 [Aeromicrobium sp.]